MNSSFDDQTLVVDRPRPKENTSSFWRKDDPVLDAEGKVVRGGMFEHQREWWDLPNFIKVLVGGFGAGKSMIQGKRIISLGLTNAPCPVATVSPTFSIARQTMVPTIGNLLAGKQTMYGSSLWWRYNKSSHEFRIRYKGREGTIICYSGEDPMSLRGPNLAAAMIDEPFMQDQEVFSQMVARVRHPDAVHREIGLGGTPEQLNWGYDLCVGDLKKKNDVGVIQASSRKNLALAPEYVQRLEGIYDERTAQAYIDAKFINLGAGQVYYGFDASEHVVEIRKPEGAELGAGMDFNVDPMASAVFWINGDHMHFFEEIELRNADTEYMCGHLKERHKTLEEIYPDATGSQRNTAAPGGRSDFHYIRDAGFRINAAAVNPKRRDRYNAVNGKFKPRSGKLTLTISPKCVKLIKYLSTYSHELMNKQKAMSHLLDAFSYPIERLFPATKDVVGVIKLRGT